MEISDLPPDIARKLKLHRVTRSIRRTPNIFTDTSDFTSIDYGDVLVVDDRYLLVTGYTKEGRFGVDEQVKQWVPRTEDLGSGKKQIVKLVFHETFEITLGQFTITCFRNPEKEASVLELVKGHPHFMQGYGALDGADNLVRILDIIMGSRLDRYIHKGPESHEQYFAEKLPVILEQYLKCLQGIGMLHNNGFRHGDIRRDHILVEYDTELFRWIDFDYDFYLPEKPFGLDMYELGNILVYLVARDDFQPRTILEHPEMGRKVLDTIEDGDLSLLSQNKVTNLAKLFPYVPKSLNTILMHFSRSAPVFYETVDEMYNDLGEVVERMGS